MRKKDVIILTYKIIKVKPKNNTTQEPDWESLKSRPEGLKEEYDTEVGWSKRTFIIKDVISIEDMDDSSILNHKEGVFVVDIKFKKLYNKIYKNK